jgi:hypothetical protein
VVKIEEEAADEYHGSDFIRASSSSGNFIKESNHVPQR